MAVAVAWVEGAGTVMMAAWGKWQEAAWERASVVSLGQEWMEEDLEEDLEEDPGGVLLVWPVVLGWVSGLLGGCLVQDGGHQDEPQLWVWELQGEQEEVAGIGVAH